jgi:hypothetical protein
VRTPALDVTRLCVSHRLGEMLFGQQYHIFNLRLGHVSHVSCLPRIQIGSCFIYASTRYSLSLLAFLCFCFFFFSFLRSFFAFLSFFLRRPPSLLLESESDEEYGL